MSCDLYLYKSSGGKFDPQEAEEIVSREDLVLTDEQRLELNRIVEILVRFNPKLEVFAFDFERIAELEAISLAEARDSRNYIEINTPDTEEYYMQFVVSKDFVSLSFGWGMSEDFISYALDHLTAIAKETGYLFYDPQSGTVSDLLHPIQLSEDESKSWKESNDLNLYTPSKPWWRFW